MANRRHRPISTNLLKQAKRNIRVMGHVGSMQWLEQAEPHAYRLLKSYTENAANRLKRSGIDDAECSHFVVAIESISVIVIEAVRLRRRQEQSAPDQPSGVMTGSGPRSRVTAKPDEFHGERVNFLAVTACKLTAPPSTPVLAISLERRCEDSTGQISDGSMVEVVVMSNPDGLLLANSIAQTLLNAGHDDAKKALAVLMEPDPTTHNTKGKLAPSEVVETSPAIPAWRSVSHADGADYRHLRQALSREAMRILTEAEAELAADIKHEADAACADIAGAGVCQAGIDHISAAMVRMAARAVLRLRREYREACRKVGGETLVDRISEIVTQQRRQAE